ncbi:MAG: hypothetical protein DI548_10945 [Flavobacterium johnsoniae]|nr:MAG: hypothetical protein DI548_10945 [Flavobacterium johnsoniae]
MRAKICTERCLEVSYAKPFRFYPLNLFEFLFQVKGHMLVRGIVARLLFRLQHNECMRNITGTVKLTIIEPILVERSRTHVAFVESCSAKDLILFAMNRCVLTATFRHKNAILCS